MSYARITDGIESMKNGYPCWVVTHTNKFGDVVLIGRIRPKLGLYSAEIMGNVEILGWYDSLDLAFTAIKKEHAALFT